MTYDLSAPADPDLAPGEARCPGPSTRDIILKDGDNPPAAIVTEQAHVPRRCGHGTQPLYGSRRYFDRRWSGCGREPGSGPAGKNTSRTRATTASTTSGPTPSRVRQRISPSGHSSIPARIAACSSSMRRRRARASSFCAVRFTACRGTWTAHCGKFPAAGTFPTSTNENFGLTGGADGTWGGFVFINLDPNAEPLNDYLEVLPEHFSDASAVWRTATWPAHRRRLLPGNWKMCMEAFLEAYHVLATHPEGLRTSAMPTPSTTVFGDNVTRFVHTIGYPSPHLPKQLVEPELFAALGHDPDDLPEGTGARQRHADLLRESLSSEWGADLSDVSTSILLDSIEYHLFPNACFFPGINIRLIYRFRPAGYDRTIHDVLLLQPVPDNEPRPKPAEIIRLGIDDSYTTVDSFVATGLAALLDQDTDNFKRQWAGMRASLRGTQTLGNYQESRIRAFHRTLDQYLES